MKARLFVISAPSGTGKTTVIKRLLSRIPSMQLSVSVTTRAPRPGERDGFDYHFIDDRKFEEMKKAGDLLEWAVVHGACYGTPRRPIEKWLKEGNNVILDIDVQGAASIRRSFKDAVLIFLLPPSREELIRRITSRGANSVDDLELRLKNADIELSKKDMYDHHVVNDDLDMTVDAIMGIIGSHGL